MSAAEKAQLSPSWGTAAARESPSPKVMPIPQGQPTPTGRAEKLRAQQLWGPSFLWPGPPWEELQAGTPKPQRVPVLSGLPQFLPLQNKELG